MTPLSPRYATALCVLLGLAIVPVTLHSYLGLRTDECEHASALTSGSGQAPPKNRVSGDALQYREGFIRSDGLAPTLRYVIVRSYDARRLYYRPEYSFAIDTPTDHTIEWIDVDGEKVPTHIPQYADSFTTQMKPVIAYLLVYDGKPLENPYLAQLMAAPRQMLTGRLPMTLFLAYANVMGDEQEAALGAAREWLASSWQLYRAACMP